MDHTSPLSLSYFNPCLARRIGLAKAVLDFFARPRILLLHQHHQQQQNHQHDKIDFPSLGWIIVPDDAEDEEEEEQQQQQEQEWTLLPSRFILLRADSDSESESELRHSSGRPKFLFHANKAHGGPPGVENKLARAIRECQITSTCMSRTTRQVERKWVPQCASIGQPHVDLKF
ncbi:hypothetical protein MPTK1_3g03960 [Marchantia polymorpha subsp. ruderalis]|uniref:Uncharacterized protein n=1 Tax=Marchantia polymorpha subsp. ruderalis TaxID=1480154 RepID=A0AAF6AX79_MARPO|nr:hypothetical protein Mp_3g03960 [Marchantia polymorpha subsp. ruderalis]